MSKRQGQAGRTQPWAPVHVLPQESWGAEGNEWLPGVCPLLPGWWPVTKAQRLLACSALPLSPPLHGPTERGSGSQIEGTGGLCVRVETAKGLMIHPALSSPQLHRSRPSA